LGGGSADCGAVERHITGFPRADERGIELELGERAAAGSHLVDPLQRRTIHHPTSPILDRKTARGHSRYQLLRLLSRHASLDGNVSGTYNTQFSKTSVPLERR